MTGVRPRVVAAIFTAAVFANAALLFSIEPMFSRMVLPLLGGSPAVWNTCMMFFQAALLGGYLYAHVVSTRLTVRQQTVLHVVLLAASVLALPIALGRGVAAPSGTAPIIWLVGLLTVSLGGPFFMLSTGAPLLQRWFSHTGHPSAANPYFLYAASNLGSMIALLAYPTLLEPSMRLATQSRLWSVAYVALIALVTLCAVLATRRAATVGATSVSGATPIESSTISAPQSDGVVTVARRLRWVALAFVPSSLLLGVTTYLSTDVAPIPLLWVAPLALYLLTFVVAFSDRVWFRPALLMALQAVFLVWIVLTIAVDVSGKVGVMAPTHLAVLFLTGLICHGALASDRPPVSRLTEFYLWISLGGMLGGVFNALIAPTVFNTVLEYPIVLVLAAAVRPLARSGTTRDRVLDVVAPLVLAPIVWVVVRNGFPLPGLSVRASLVAFATFPLLCLAFQRRPVRFALGLAVILVGGAFALAHNEQLLYRGRSFFGVHKVVRMSGIRALQHGTTVHGGQSTDSREVLEPLIYYHRRSPIAQVFTTLMTTVPSRRVGIVGLGTGSLACYGRKNERWTFYEIDPLVERIARTPAYFTFLRDCPPTTDVVIGDGRLSLARAPDASFDLIIIDAFGSDAIPVHLLTREALGVYLRKLKPDGAVAFHISNRYLDLEPVVANAATSISASALIGSDTYLSPEERGPNRSLSKWVLVSASPSGVAALTALEGWRQPNSRDQTAWTDDFSNVLSVFHWRQ